MEERLQPDSTPPRVAVIVVHGVANQPPNQSVRQIANMLARLDTAAAPVYSDFSEQTVRMPVRRVPVQRSQRRTSFYERTAAQREAVDVGNLFTESVLANYPGEGPDATYETVRISARRGGADPNAVRDVDLYEMYWADLSRVGTSAWRILGELYQVLLHLPSVGKHAVSAATSAPRARAYSSATVFKRSTAVAAWALSVPIAVLNVCFLAGAVPVLASLIDPTLHQIAAIGIAVAIALTIFVTGLRRIERRGAVTAVTIVTIVLAVGAVLVAGQSPSWAPQLLGAEAIGAGIAIAALILRTYAKQRPGTGAVSSAGIATIAIVAALAIRHAVATDLRFDAFAKVGFRVTEALYVLATVAWALFFAAMFVSLIAGAWFAVRMGRQLAAGDELKSSPERRVARTARVTLAVPAALFLFLTVALWAGIYQAVEMQVNRPDTAVKTFSPFEHSYQLSWIMHYLLQRSVCTGKQFVDIVLASSLGSALTVSAGLIAAGALLTLIPLIPVVFREIAPPRLRPGPAHGGWWLSGLFLLLRFTGGVVVAGVATIAIAQVVTWFKLPGLCPASMSWTSPRDLYACVAGSTSAQWFVHAFGVMVAGTAVGLMAFQGRLQTLAGGFRAPVDVGLDVDGYLREHPADRAPRARIFARYYSLLNYIDGLGYDSVVVIAHSQGSVITADLLRFLKHRGIGSIRTPIHFFTMGNPLRQLYGRRFPHMYQWVWDDDRARSEKALKAGAASRSTPTLKPDPRELGVASWVNVYRSGDYIGRWLWHSDTDSDLFDTVERDWTTVSAAPRQQSADESHAPPRREYCIGAGAHTHYWDSTAPAVAVELDSLIRDSAGRDDMKGFARQLPIR